MRAAAVATTSMLQNVGVIIGSSHETDLASCLGYDKFSGVFMEQIAEKWIPSRKTILVFQKEALATENYMFLSFSSYAEFTPCVPITLWATVSAVSTGASSKKLIKMKSLFFLQTETKFNRFLLPLL